MPASRHCKAWGLARLRTNTKNPDFCSCMVSSQPLASCTSSAIWRPSYQHWESRIRGENPHFGLATHTRRYNLSLHSYNVIIISYYYNMILYYTKFEIGYKEYNIFYLLLSFATFCTIQRCWNSYGFNMRDGRLRGKSVEITKHAPTPRTRSFYKVTLWIQFLCVLNIKIFHTWKIIF